MPNLLLRAETMMVKTTPTYVPAAQRGNRALEAAVNRGLAAVYLLGLTAGARLMREEGVPPQVMSRVLMHPAQRRAGDWRRC